MFAADRHQLLDVNQVAVGIVHEVQMAAPTRADHGQGAGHGFHVWNAPAFAARGQHESIGSGIQPRHVAFRNEVCEQHNVWNALRVIAQGAHVRINLFADGLRIASIGVHAQQQAHVVLRLEGGKVGAQQHIPAFAPVPLKY